jgi:radical SAM family uncharacterized protein
VTGSPRRVRPLEEPGGRLLGVEKPARYLGGEAGVIRKEGDGLLSVALCFPDLYEIGMSNNAIRILYSTLNASRGVRAERVFAPAPDFEALLSERGLPLYTLETGTSIRDVDILGFSLGYELAATSVLAVLSSGGVPLLAEERGERDPIVIAGGPAASNPRPLSRFLDAAFIGEAESEFIALCEELYELKAAGEGRAGLLSRLRGADAVWMPARDGREAKRARRAVFSGFSRSPAGTALPLPSVRTVQDHGTVEIMRGCPNGCRFCHAGYFYRPQRMKDRDVIRAEVESLVRDGGHREITLSSLSSGDYSGIGELLDELNARWNPERVSFQLPSLKVNSFTLPILSKLAEVRKSGLTFAVETPIEAWQRLINKDVDYERSVSILEAARAAGFKQAKFYFMIGLPVPASALEEARAIAEYVERLCSRSPSMQVNVNVGTFVPKPHTPFQWCRQLGEEESLAAITELRSTLRRRKNVKVSYHSPFASLLEGIIARGDERVGGLILEAFRRGARLDAWEEHFDRELWRSVIEAADWPVIDSSCGERAPDEELPWDDISIRVSKSALRREFERAMAGEITSGCIEECAQPCGSCSDEVRVTAPAGPGTEAALAEKGPELPARRPVGRIVIRYRKEREAAYLQHLGVVDALSRAMLMRGIDAAYSEGFNPMPRIETTQPIPIAIDSRGEIASVLMYSAIDPADFERYMNERLPAGMRIEEARYFLVVEGRKLKTIGSLEWGTEYLLSRRGGGVDNELEESLRTAMSSREIKGALLERVAEGCRLRLPLPDKKENGLIRILEECVSERPVQSVVEIVKLQALARLGDEDEPGSFFDAYSRD